MALGDRLTTILFNVRCIVLILAVYFNITKARATGLPEILD